ncbi:tRNA lysidine(34) synthetase TilS [Tepidibacter formicigenes]|jgi:tRNA(Ile)-lysidine synthase|uniref:tRNA(Ile)-lysidine synthase n=1 Tax=Tepidibacter formicigenes DSM 15518 TaxID=1123349 RepID=A0A1M6TPT3_9FIRM|nr:tRNA lysidine(34) synthetase TilS [Tepidibacter formicigenes]SHK59001.1 tRNA(Ile)-lysidine synthase [Tepidibacter formicigenes DSM 15518]
MIVNKVRDTIKKHNLLSDGDKVILGLSGGPDSVCLLHILNYLKDEFNIKLYAAHLNHKIRGIEAQKDAMYVAKICDVMGVVCFIRAIDVPKYCEENNLSLEEGARILRYNMFFEIKEKINANKIAIAHNINDQAETVLMRIMRGTGLQGLKGIEYKRTDGIIRPLLDVPREEIEKYCEENNLNPRIDYTNLQDIYTRNKIRLKLIPYMKENFNPNLKESIARMANLLREDSDYIEEQANKVFYEVCEKKSENMLVLDIEEFLKVHKALKNRIIRKSINFILGNIKGIDQKHIQDVFNLIFENKSDIRIDLPKGLMVYKKKNKIIFTNEELIEGKISYNYKLPKSGYIKIKELNAIVESKILSIEEVDNLKYDEYTKFFDADKIYGNLLIRSRRNGDKIKILGLGGNKKIKDLFIDLKIPKESRDKIPILSDEKGIIWVMGYRMSEDYKIDKDTKNVLKVSLKLL